MLGVLPQIGRHGGRYDPSTVKHRERDLYFVTNLAAKRMKTSTSVSHSCTLLPHAPWRFVMMLSTLSRCFTAITWSRRRAAVMRWSQSFSSSLRSTVVCAHKPWTHPDTRRPYVSYTKNVKSFPRTIDIETATECQIYTTKMPPPKTKKSHDKQNLSKYTKQRKLSGTKDSDNRLVLTDKFWQME